MKLRSFLYKFAQFLGDINAVQKGRIGKRVKNRIVGRIVGKLLGRMFKVV